MAGPVHRLGHPLVGRRLLEGVTLRIERARPLERTVIRLIGRIQSESLADVRRELERPEPKPALDLSEVSLVDAGVVRVLIGCEDSGMELVHCSPYIRHWMDRERAGSDNIL